MPLLSLSHLNVHVSAVKQDRYSLPIKCLCKSHKSGFRWGYRGNCAEKVRIRHRVGKVSTLSWSWNLNETELQKLSWEYLELREGNFLSTLISLEMSCIHLLHRYVTLSLCSSQVSHPIPSIQLSLIMERLAVSQLSPWMGCQSIARLPPPPFLLVFYQAPWLFSSTHLYSWVERGTVIVKCFVKDIDHRKYLNHFPILCSVCHGQCHVGSARS